MASTSLQLVGFILGVLSWIGMIVTCASPEWRKNNFVRSAIDSQIRYEGLWAACTASMSGQTNCRQFTTFFINLPGEIQVCRALMISAIVLGFLATIITILGIKCTSIGNSNPRTKARAAIIGGILFLIAGLHVGLAASLYAGCTSSKCFDHLQVTSLQTNYELGPAIISGWVIMTSSFWAAILIIMNYNAWSKPTKIIDLSQIRADPSTGQFSDIVSEGAKAIVDGVSVSYFAHTVVKEYHNPVDDDSPMHLRYEYGIGLFIGWASLVTGILGGAITTFTSIYVVSRLNAFQKGRRLLPGPRARGQRMQRASHLQRQQPLPLGAQHQRISNNAMQTRINHGEDGALTKHRIAQHNAKLSSNTGPAHHPPRHMNHYSLDHKPTSHGESSKSSIGRKNWSSSSPVKNAGDQPDSSQYSQHHRHHHHHNHRQHMQGIKSENQLMSRSIEKEECDDSNDNDAKYGTTNGGHTRRRPAKEYV